MAKGATLCSLVFVILVQYGQSTMHLNGSLNNTYNETGNYSLSNNTYYPDATSTTTYTTFYTTFTSFSTSFNTWFTTIESTLTEEDDEYQIDCVTSFPFDVEDISEITTTIINTIIDYIKSLFTELFGGDRRRRIRRLLADGDDSFEIVIQGYNLTMNSDGETVLTVNFYIITTIKDTVDDVTDFIGDSSDDGYSNTITDLIEDDDTFANITLGEVSSTYELVAVPETTFESTSDSKKSSKSLDWLDTSTYKVVNWLIFIAFLLVLLVLVCCAFRLCCWMRQRKEERRKSLYEIGGGLFKVDSAQTTSDAETHAFNSDLNKAIEMQQRGTLLKKPRDPLETLDVDDVDAAFDEKKPFKTKTKGMKFDPNPIHPIRSESSGGAASPETTTATTAEKDTYDLL